MLTFQCPGKDLIKAQAKSFLFACTNVAALNHVDKTYSKWKTEEIKLPHAHKYTNA